MWWIIDEILRTFEKLQEISEPHPAEGRKGESRATTGKQERAGLHPGERVQKGKIKAKY